MNKYLSVVPLVIPFFLTFSCRKQVHVERIMEDGVEVVINHLEPYKVRDQLSILDLEREITIDTENDEIIETGLVDIETFDIDEEGHIYIILWASNDDFVFKFNNQGQFEKSFVRRGQGPGEINWGGSVRYTGNNRLKIKDPSKTKYSVFNTEGEFLEDVQLNTRVSILKEFSNGKLFIFWQDHSLNKEKIVNHLGLSDQGLENIEEFYSCSFPDITVVEKAYAPGNFWVEGTSENLIFVGNVEMGYEILVFDLEGNLVRKIRKKHTPVELTEAYISTFLERRKRSSYTSKYELRKNFPPFQYLFTDEEGRLFVMTYEKGLSANEWIFDIFTPDGIFIGKVSIESRIDTEQISIKVKDSRLYSVSEKESGYKELVVYKMKWE